MMIEEARALLQECVDVLEGSRCKYKDPGVRVRWNQRKIHLMNQLREILEKES